MEGDKGKGDETRTQIPGLDVPIGLFWSDMWDARNRRRSLKDATYGEHTLSISCTKSVISCKASHFPR